MSQTIDENDLPLNPISKPKFIYCFFVLYMLFALDLAVRLGVTVVLPGMQQELGFSDSQVGLISSVVLLGMSLFVLPFSFIADKTSKKTTVGVMGTIWGIGSILCAIAVSPIMIILGRFTIGAGNASFAPVSVSMLTSWVRKARWGMTIGIYNSAMSVGMGLGTMVSAALVAVYSWRMPFYVLGALTFVFVFLSLFLPKDVKYDPDNCAQPKVAVKEAVNVTFTNKTLICFSFASGLSNFVLASISTWLPMFLVREAGWDIAAVGAILGPVYLAGGLLLAPIGGITSDYLAKFSKRWRVWLSVPIFITVGLLNLYGIASHNIVAFIIGFLLLNFPYVGFHTATQELVPVRYRATSYGTYVAILQMLGFVGPIVAGLMSESLGLTMALNIIQLFLGLAALLSFMAGIFYMKDYNKAVELECMPPE